jgi:hypothetical protein
MNDCHWHIVVLKIKVSWDTVFTDKLNTAENLNLCYDFITCFTRNLFCIDFQTIHVISGNSFCGSYSLPQQINIIGINN